jgi:hypothetical protein
MNPLVISIETSYEALMIFLNFILILGIWHRQVRQRVLNHL